MIPDVTTLQHREQLGDWLNQNGLLGTGVELGVATGGFAKIVLKTWRGARYVMVDLWCDQDKRIYRESQTSGIPEQDRDYAGWLQLCRDMQAQDARIDIIRAHSVDAARLIPDSSLDWLYIDANHDYVPFANDLEWWYPKVRPGGLVAGHDCMDNFEHGNWMKVKSALEDWNREYGYSIHLTCCTSWYLIKR